ncbi:MAG: oxygen-independent coproporphyrinogen III oxidase [Rhodospirillaceae bacterium]|nr:oxygen-independent coproporphyrinogen III oxidase [Rhodospirillaceae bacterium]MBT5666206.1 oxygen-independent coproporphyrinogen III oxidase [Rhodospirillaceae bacterium]MBT5811422.1 oxygen-independent coproporphyrinogen III oxidase [Rhodospirillaceae bacterium]
MIADLIARYDQRVPRYTSYPTAPHFAADVTVAHYRQWLAELESKDPISLYLHVPFCREMCWYCGCNTRATRRHRPIAAYHQRLLAEIDLTASALPDRMTASHIHFGGGSPNMLTPDEFNAVMARLRNSFNLTEGAEIAVEIDPRTTTDAFIDSCAASGVTRLSLGVQDLNAAVQKAVNRIQPFESIARIADRAKHQGVTDVNIDLMYGLPGQTVENILTTIDKALTLEPTRIALFGYAHVPWMKPHMRLIDDSALPDAAARWKQAAVAKERLAAHGYVAVGMDHFARPDTPLAQAAAAQTLRRNFQGYTTDTATTLLGFGASSIGQTPRGYVQNDADVRRWSKAVDAGKFAIVKGRETNADDHMRRDIIEQLMCNMTVDAEAVAARHGFGPSSIWDSLDALGPMVADGLVVVDGPVVSMTEQGAPLVRAAAAAFDRYLAHNDAQSPRHARAV